MCKFFWSGKNVGPEKSFMSEKNFKFCKKFWVKKDFESIKALGKHRLCVTIRFLVCSVIADFGGVLLVVLALIVA